MIGVYQGHGIRFVYPRDWELDVDDDGPVTTVTLESEGTAFALVRFDSTQPEPEDLADEALEAMRSEYPDLDASPARATLAGREAVGYDAEFFSFDLANAFAIRCFRTDGQTVFVFGQWSQLDDDGEPALVALWQSIEEVVE